MNSETHGLILVVEDEKAIADLQRMYLAKAGFGVHVVHDGNEALKAIRDLQPAAVVLDIGIPGIDGIEIVKQIRSDGNWTPVLFCTARDEEVDRVLGLELGADDYISKPFSPRELVARVRASVRRNLRSAEGGEASVTFDGVSINRSTRKVSIDGNEVEFTATEFDLLAYLMARPGRVITREQLLSDVWGYAAYVSHRTVDTHIAQVRAKLGENHSFIRTVRGVGYSAEVK
ncbi:MAG: DNA-binding response regulator [Actinomycetota bacterium]|jgi:DNA-binding response OmpR family regulator